MRIVSLTLIGYKRFASNIKRFVLTPHEIAQIIIGSNGSGKSGLLDQLTCLPPSKDDFSKDGKKVIVYHHKGKTITCSSTFGPTHHSFDVDGEERNPGGTERVQREWCEKVFGINQEIHDLQRGFIKFTDMSTADRRYWMTKLCVTNYDYAMSAYDTIKTRYNQLNGALSINGKNLGTETAKLVSKDEEAKLEEEVAILLSELNILTRESIPLDKTSQQYTTMRDKMLKDLSDTSLRLLKNKIAVPLLYNDGKLERDEWGELKRTQFQSLGEIDQEIDRLRHLVTGKEVLIQAATELYQKQQKNHDILIAAGQNGVANLMEQQKNWGQELIQAQGSLKMNLTFDQNQLGAIRLSFDAIKGALVDLFDRMPSNPFLEDGDRCYGKARLQRTQKALQEGILEKNRLQQIITQHQAKIDHADEHRKSGSVVCPSCSHSFVVGISEVAYQNVKRLIADDCATVQAINIKEAELQAEIAQMEAYFHQYREFMSYTEKAPVLHQLWKHLLQEKTVMESPTLAVSELRVFDREIDKHLAIAQLQHRINEAVKLQKSAEEVGSASLAEVDAVLADISRQLGLHTAELAKLQYSISMYQQYRKQIATGQQLAEEVKRLYQLAETTQLDLVEALRRESIAHCINQVQQVLALKQGSLRHIQMQRGIVKALEQQIAQLSVQREAAKMMMEALSPINGLIAEGLLGFIRNFVGRMNAIIDRIFTYPLRVIPTGFDSDSGEQSTELDYKFKMYVGTNGNIVKDVKLGSDGQREVINLAYMLTALFYSDLSDAPLLFDELGRTLDAVHRIRATNEVKRLLETQNISQMFMVNHYAHIYESFTNAEICVLESSNVTVPQSKRVNQHVTFT